MTKTFFPKLRILSILLLAVSASHGCDSRENGALRVTGQIEGSSVAAGSRIGGRVAEVLVSKGDSVTKGQLLVLLESAEANAVVAAAEARLRQMQAALDKIKAGPRRERLAQARATLAQTEHAYDMALKGARSQEISAARGQVDTAKANRDSAELNFKRQKKLFEGNAGSAQMRDIAEHSLEAAEGVYKSSQQKLDLLVRGTRDEQVSIAMAGRDLAKAILDELVNGARLEDIAGAKALRDGAVAEVARTQTALDEMSVASPMDGVVESLDVLAGDIVRPGPILEIVDPEDLELIVYVSAGFLGHLRLGQRIDISTDSHGDRMFEGAISHISNRGEFTPRNLQTEEERVQQVFAVTVDLNSAEGALRAGMSATAHLTKMKDGDS